MECNLPIVLMVTQVGRINRRGGGLEVERRCASLIALLRADQAEGLMAGAGLSAARSADLAWVSCAAGLPK